jgi:hypothetical protein
VRRVITGLSPRARRRRRGSVFAYGRVVTSGS